MFITIEKLLTLNKIDISGKNTILRVTFVPGKTKLKERIIQRIKVKQVKKCDVFTIAKASVSYLDVNINVWILEYE